MTEKNYTIYNFNPIQGVLYTCVYIGISSVYSLLFYDSLLPVLFTLFLLKIYYKFLKEYLVNKQKEKLLAEFKEWLFSLNTSLTSGYALENAIAESLIEMETLYGKKSFMYNEALLMSSKLKFNIPLEEILSNFSLRSGLNDINTFSEVITLVKKNGGDMINVIKNASESIGEEIALKNQIATTVSSSRYELYIMAAFPLLIIKYIDLTQPGFFMPLYHNLFGIIVMTVALCIYFSSLAIANNILKFTRRF